MEQEINYLHEDMTGEISVKLSNGQTLDDFCVQHIADYNRDRLEALAIRLYVGDETIITVFAVDKNRQENTDQPDEKLPVKKFKLEGVAIAAVFAFCQGFNCTLTTGNYPLEAMEVINK